MRAYQFLRGGMLAAVFTGLWCISGVVDADCRADIAKSTPDSRYTDRGDGTVIDVITGLQWMKCTLGERYDASTKSCVVQTAALQLLDWDDALRAVVTFNSAGGVAGLNDWRMPNLKELGSIIERSCTDPSINTTAFPTTPSDLFWSSTPIFRGLTTGYPIDFSDGREVAFPVIESLDANHTGLRTRLVRQVNQ